MFRYLIKLNQKRGFTLIELLIVIAIILILVAVALPNFVNARIRAQVTRVKTDMRMIANALFAYHTDYRRMLNPCGAEDPVASGKYRPDLPRDYCPGGGLRYTVGGNIDIAVLGRQLTSPNEYVEEVPFDPFNSAHMQDDSGTMRASMLYYGRWEGSSAFGTNAGPWGIILNKDRFLLESFGPDLQHYGFHPGPLAYVYDPTNGINSYGDIFYTSIGGFMDEYPDPNYRRDG